MHRAVQLAALVGLLAVAGLAGAIPSQGFIRVSNGRFVDDACREYFFAGWNGWRMLDYATNAVTPPGFPSGRAFLTDLFRRAKAKDLNVFRFFLFGEGDTLPIITSAGTLNENVAQGLDFVLTEAAKLDIKLVLVPSNFWINGVKTWEQWCGTDKLNRQPAPAIDLRPKAPLNASEREQTPVDWYLSKTCRDQYKGYITALANRVNTINGLKYKDDPTIFAWNGLNEPRCKYCGPAPVDQWYADILVHLKTVAPNHMVTTGEEGFFDESSQLSSANPNDPSMWGMRTGQDFVANHAAADYMVTHMWPDNWDRKDLAFGRTWLDAHIQAATAAGKPLVMEEFGKRASKGNATSVRDPWYQLVYGTVNDNLRTGGPLRGALFWQWSGGNGQDANSYSDNVYDDDSTFTTVISGHTQSLSANHKASAALVPGCKPRTPPAARPGRGAPPAAALPIPAGQGGDQSRVTAAAGRRLLEE